MVFGIIWVKLPFGNGGWNLVINIITLALAVLLGWIISATTIFASGYVIIDNKSIGEAFKKAWKLLHEHLLVSFEISAIMTLLDILIIIIFGVLVSYSFIPSLFVWLLAGAFGSTTLALFGTVFGFALLMIFITIFGGIYNTFYTSVWMYLFMKMHHEGVFSRLIHHFGGFFRK
jgi:hypothetical protein